MLEIWKNIKDRWFKKTGYEKCYFIGFIAAGFTVLVFVNLGINSYAYKILISFCCCMAASGLFLWSKPFVKVNYREKLKQSLSYFSKGIIAIASIGYARMYVSDALGLPPNDFELTVAALAILLGYLIWVFVFVVLAYISGFLFMTVSMLISLISYATISTLRLFVNNTKIDAISLAWKTKSTNYLGHSFGFFVLAICGALIFQWSTTIIKNNLRFIRLMAYGLDYQKATKYPLVEQNVQFVLHDNGVISYAVRDGYDIKITVVRTP